MSSVFTGESTTHSSTRAHTSRPTCFTLPFGDRSWAMVHKMAAAMTRISHVFILSTSHRRQGGGHTDQQHQRPRPRHAQYHAEGPAQRIDQAAEPGLGNQSAQSRCGLVYQIVQPQVEEAAPETAETTQPEPAPQPTATPETAVTFTANTAGLPNLDAPENSPRFLCPVEYTYISRYMDYGHRGDDLTSDKGTPVYAAQDGVVTYADFHYSYGYCVILDHGTGPDGNQWSTLYAHMDDYTVATGQVVKAGELIGHVGTTGASTGPHLHFEVFLNGGVTQPCYLTAYREEDTQPLTAEMVQELLAQAAENQSNSEDPLPLESQALTATQASLQEQLDRLTEQRNQLQASLEEMDQQFHGTEEERQQLRENMEDTIQVTEEQIQMVEDTLALVETEIQAQKDAMITRQSELQQQIDAAQSSGNAGTAPALDAGAEAARQQLDAAAQQVDSYLSVNRDQNG